VKAGLAVLSVDAKQRELIGLFKNPGKTWRKTAINVLASDYPAILILAHLLTMDSNQE
jgi:hypothetical protein